MQTTEKDLPRICAGAYALSGAVWGMLACAIELVAESAGMRAIVAGTLLGLAGGATMGGLLGALFCGLRAISQKSWIARLFWLLPGVAAARWMFEFLNIAGHLEDDQYELAQKAAVGCAILALLMWAWGALLQPTLTKPRGVLGQWRGVRVFCALAMVALSGIAFYMDGHLLVGLYLDAHLLVRLLGLAVGCTGFALFWPLRVFAWKKLWAGALLMGFLVSAILIRFEHQAAIGQLMAAPLPSTMMTFARLATDVDRDGSSSFWGGGDCAPFDAAIHPRAREIPNDGVDNNCIAGDFKGAAAENSADVIPFDEASAETSVVLITIDSTRPDHMSAYGYERETTPNIKKFAEHARRYHRAYASGAWTSLALPSMIRGVYPRRILWTKIYETVDLQLLTEEEAFTGEPKKLVNLFGTPLLDTHPVLPEILQAHGIWTIAVWDDGVSQFFDPKFGYQRGFDRYDRVKSSRGDAATIDHAIFQLADRPKNQRFFMWVHLAGPHWPNVLHDEVEQFGESLSDQYDHCLLYADTQIGRLLNELERISNSERLQIVLSADHGETFDLVCHFHGTDVDEPQIQIPLLVKASDMPAGDTDTLASFIDLMPTVLHWFGIAPPSGIDAVPLQANAQERVLIAETWRNLVHGKGTIDRIAAVDGTYKLVFDRIGLVKKLVIQNSKRENENLWGQIQKDSLTKTLERYIEETGGEQQYAK